MGLVNRDRVRHGMFGFLARVAWFRLLYDDFYKMGIHIFIDFMDHVGEVLRPAEYFLAILMAYF